MALFSSQLCPWNVNGDIACNKESFVTIDSGGAKLGQSCANEDCIDGTCFRAKNEKEGTCRHVLLEGDKGCNKENYVCTTGLSCYSNTCLKEPPRWYRWKSDDKKTNKATTNDESQTYMYILYGFIAAMFILLLIMIVILVSQSLNSPSSM